MSHRQKPRKFSLFKADKHGPHRGKVLLCANQVLPSAVTQLSVQDLIDFLKKEGIEPANVPLPLGFTVFMKL